MKKLSMSVLAVLLVAGSSGCVVWYGVDYMPSAHVKKILASEGTSEQLSGRITKTFDPVPGGELAKASNTNFALAYLGIKDGKACFLGRGYASYRKDEPHGREDADAYVRRWFEDKVLVFQARKTLEEISGWPHDPPTQVESLDISLQGEKRVFNVNGFRDNPDRGTSLTYDVVMCGPAPAIAADSKYLTVICMPKKSMGGLGARPSLLVWTVDPSAVAAAETDATGAAPASATPVATDLVGVLTRDGRFTTFLDALKKVGLGDALSGKQPITVFAPTNAAFTALGDAKLKALLADPVRLKDVLQNHLVVDAYQATQFGTAKRPSRLKTVNGKIVRVRSDNGKVFIENRPVSTTDISADGGIIHVVEGVLDL